MSTSQGGAGRLRDRSEKYNNSVWLEVSYGGTKGKRRDEDLVAVRGQHGLSISFNEPASFIVKL